jgi:hypothetical protein
MKRSDGRWQDRLQDRIDGAIPLHNVYGEPAFYVPVADDHLRAAQTADKICWLYNRADRGGWS